MAAVLGPGMITSNVDNDAGGIYTYSVCGADTATASCGSSFPSRSRSSSCRRCARGWGRSPARARGPDPRGVRAAHHVSSHDAPAAHQSGERGRRISPGSRARLEVLGVCRWISVPLGAAAIWWLIVFGTYRSAERIFLIACLVYFAYPISAIPREAGLGRGRRGDADAFASRRSRRDLRWWWASSARRSPRGCSSTCSPSIVENEIQYLRLPPRSARRDPGLGRRGARRVLHRRRLRGDASPGRHDRRSSPAPMRRRRWRPWPAPRRSTSSRSVSPSPPSSPPASCRCRPPIRCARVSGSKPA